MSKVVVIGSLNADLTVEVQKLPKPGETLLGGDVRHGRGGKGANQAVAAARAGGIPTAMIGAVGNDEFGRWLVEGLIADGIDVGGVSVSTRPSGTALITVDATGENTIIVAAGANNDVVLDEAAHTQLAEASVVLAQLEVPQSVLAKAAALRPAGALFILNAAPAARLLPELAAQIDLLIVNESEALAISRADELDAALAKLGEQFPAVVLTLGSRGSRYLSKSVRLTQPSFPVEAVDAVGAGDTYCGVLAAALAKGTAISEALELASRAAAISVTRTGAQESVPTEDELVCFPVWPGRPSTVRSV